MEAASVLALSMWIEVICAVIASGLSLLLVAYFAHRVFHEDRMIPLVLPICLGTVFAAVGMTNGYLLRLTNRVVILAILQPVFPVLRLLALWGVVFRSGSIEDLAWLYALAGLVTVAISTVILSRQMRISFGRSLFRTSLRPAVSFVRPMIPYIFSSNLITYAKIGRDNGDKLILGWLSDSGTLGIYSLAKMLIGVGISFRDTFAGLIFPELCKFYAQADYKRFATYLRRIVSVGLPLVTLVVLVAIVFAPQIIELISGGRFPSSASIFRIMVFGFLWIPVSWGHQASLAVGRPFATAVSNVVPALVYVAVMLILVPNLGVVGAAISYLVYMGSITVSSIWQTLSAASHFRKELALKSEQL